MVMSNQKCIFVWNQKAENKNVIIVTKADPAETIYIQAKKRKQGTGNREGETGTGKDKDIAGREEMRCASGLESHMNACKLYAIIREETTRL